MITQMKTYRVTCDECEKQVLMHGLCCFKVPEGWGTLGTGVRDPFGRKHREYCPECLSVKMKEKKLEENSVMEDGDENQRWFGVG